MWKREKNLLNVHTGDMKEMMQEGCSVFNDFRKLLVSSIYHTEKRTDNSSLIYHIFKFCQYDCKISKEEICSVTQHQDSISLKMQQQPKPFAKTTTETVSFQHNSINCH